MKQVRALNILKVYYFWRCILRWSLLLLERMLKPQTQNKLGSPFHINQFRETCRNLVSKICNQANEEGDPKVLLIHITDYITTFRFFPFWTKKKICEGNIFESPCKGRWRRQTKEGICYSQAIRRDILPKSDLGHRKNKAPQPKHTRSITQNSWAVCVCANVADNSRARNNPKVIRGGDHSNLYSFKTVSSF